MRRGFERNFLPFGEDFMAPARSMPFCECGRPVHALDHLTPTDAGVVSAERNLTFLGSIWDDAHFRAPEVIRPEILEPHTFNAQYAPIIRVRPRFHSIIAIAVGTL